MLEPLLAHARVSVTSAPSRGSSLALRCRANRSPNPAPAAVVAGGGLLAQRSTRTRRRMAGASCGAGLGAGEVSIRTLVSECVDLAQRAGDQIRAVSNKVQAGTAGAEQSLGLLDKGAGTGAFDPQTLADRQAQRCIVENLRQVYGMALRVVGEEGELGTEEGDVEDIGMHRPDAHLLDDEWPSSADLLLPLSDLCVWVDPLDGTKEFTEGRYEFVSTLIGISRLGRPIAGVISEPYRESRILWGCCAPGAFSGVRALGSSWRKPPRLAGRCLVLVSRSRTEGAVAEALQRLSAPGSGLGEGPLVTGQIAAGGAGHKAARVVDGEGDLWLFPRPGTSRWDTCAPEAMLEASGGQLRDRFGEHIVYDPDGEMKLTCQS
ncbi:unnamed protein product [Effrenium voratum]|nr:unnamed protein product [Effrenium voratum]